MAYSFLLADFVLGLTRRTLLGGALGSALGNAQMRKKLEQAGKRSPNGKKIVFGSYRKSNYEEVFKMNADGTDVKRLIHDPADDYSSAWSPDGKKIVFARYDYDDKNNEVYSMNADGTGLVNLTNNPAYDDSPDWQPFFPIIQP
jgi:dipeptidyl aminopeptidase/acylaminoacyl peptidase